MNSVRLHLIKFTYDWRAMNRELYMAHSQWMQRKLRRKVFLLRGANGYDKKSNCTEAVLTGELEDSDLETLLSTYPLKDRAEVSINISSFWVDERHQSIPFVAIGLTADTGSPQKKNVWQFSSANDDFDDNGEHSLIIEMHSAKEGFHPPGFPSDSQLSETTKEPLPLSDFLAKASQLLSMPKKPVFPDLSWVKRAWIDKKRKDGADYLIYGEDEAHRIAIWYHNSL